MNRVDPQLSLVSDSPVEVYSAGDLVQAHCVCRMLEDSGVPAKIVGDGLLAAHGAVPYVYPRVWVKQCDIAHASALVAEWEAQVLRGLQSQPEWTRRTNYGTIVLAIALLIGAPLTVLNGRHTERGNHMLQVALHLLLPAALLLAMVWIVVFPMLYLCKNMLFLR